MIPLNIAERSEALRDAYRLKNRRVVTAAVTRRVRTSGGAEMYGQPIGSVIVPDPVPADRGRSRKAKGKGLFSRKAKRWADRDEALTAIGDRVSDVARDFFGPNVEALIDKSDVGVEIRLVGQDRSGNRVSATIVRDVDVWHGVPGTPMHVVNVGFYMNRIQQGRGFGGALTTALHDMYRKAGVESVVVSANADVGGYTWARLGFDFDDPAEGLRMLKQFRTAVNMAVNVPGYREHYARMPQYKGVPTGAWDAALDQIDALLARPVPPTPLELAMIGHTKGASTWPGKAFMLSQTWDGTLRLNPSPVTAAGDSWRWQLRDRRGRWIEMGAEVKWLAKGRWLHGTVTGSPSPGMAEVEEYQTLRKHVIAASRLEVVEEAERILDEVSALRDPKGRINWREAGLSGEVVRERIERARVSEASRIPEPEPGPEPEPEPQIGFKPWTVPPGPRWDLGHDDYRMRTAAEKEIFDVTKAVLLEKYPDMEVTAESSMGILTIKGVLPEDRDREPTVKIQRAVYTGREVRDPDRRYIPNVRNDLMRIKKQHQGSGIGAELTRRYEALYRDRGVKEIHLTANIDVGGYAWARAGYDFDMRFYGDDEVAQFCESTMDKIVTSSQSSAFSDEHRALVREQVDALRDRLYAWERGEAERPTPLELAMIGYIKGANPKPERHELWPGKIVMLSRTWNASKTLHAQPMPVTTARPPMFNVDDIIAMELFGYRTLYRVTGHDPEANTYTLTTAEGKVEVLSAADVEAVAEPEAEYLYLERVQEKTLQQQALDVAAQRFPQVQAVPMTWRDVLGPDHVPWKIRAPGELPSHQMARITQDLHNVYVARLRMYFPPDEFDYTVDMNGIFIRRKSDGQRTLDIRRTVNVTSTGRISIEHEWFQLAADYQRMGIGADLNALVMDLYRDNGVHAVNLVANIDVGGYAWARAGYDWDETAFQYRADDGPEWYDDDSSDTPVVQWIDHQIDVILDKFMSDDDDRLYSREQKDAARADIRALRRLMVSGVTPTPLELAMVGHTPGATSWPGKDAMLGSNWSAKKVL